MPRFSFASVPRPSLRRLVPRRSGRTSVTLRLSPTHRLALGYVGAALAQLVIAAVLWTSHGRLFLAIPLGCLALLGLLAFFSARMFAASNELRQETERIAAALVHNEGWFRSVVESSPDALLATGLDGNISMANLRAGSLLGFANPRQLRGRSLHEVLPELNSRWPERETTGKAKLPDASREAGVEALVTRADGSSFVAEVLEAQLQTESGDPTGRVFVIRDISEHKVLEETLRYQATHDALTELPNRSLLRDRIEQAIKLHKRSGSTFALMVLDLNSFKGINDTFGHDLGDDLLHEFAVRLRGLVRESDSVARLGGDEFALLLPGTSESGARHVASEVQAAIAQSFVLKGERFLIKSSIGISLYPDHGTDLDTLLRHADIAMYAAKASDRDAVVFEADQDHKDPQKLALLGELYEAIEANQLVLHYQPKVRLDTGRIDCVEALIRWNHPTRGFIPPNEFIPFAERSEIIKHLTLWVVRTALKQCRKWHDAGLAVSVAVNLSAHNLHDPDLPNAITRILRQCSASPTWLKLEVTETAVMTDPRRASDILTQLDGLGVTLSIDDFGTGYSSLAHLRNLPFKEIKIDRSFVGNMLEDGGNAAIVRSVIDLGHGLNLQVVAEGVEDQATLERLRESECDQAQGFYLSRPVPARKMTAWLKTRRNSCTTRNTVTAA